jgi:hypothetical protein
MSLPEQDKGSPQKEVDFLVYRGNAVPRVIRLVWTLFTIFLIYYLFFSQDEISQSNFVKDLLSWISRAKG